MAWFYFFIYFGVHICFQSLAVNIGDLLTSLTDVQELLNAYNKKDYIETAIKIVDLKLKLDPPEANSANEKQLLRLKNSLCKLHPFTLKIQTRALNIQRMLNNTRGTISKRQSKRILTLIEYLDRIKNSVDNVVETLKTNLQTLVGSNDKIDGNVNYSVNAEEEQEKEKIEKGENKEKDEGEDEEEENEEEEEDEEEETVENTNENETSKD